MSSLLVDLIRRKRDGGRLEVGELRALTQAIGDGRLVDAQVAALAMAIACRGMDRDEVRALTLGLRDSGTRLDWSDLPGPALDKHSTGGVGDTVSLLLAPLLAACGGYVPMLSGRGLGHTGGTLDKIESIPGVMCSVTPARLRQVIEAAGCAIVGQSEDLVPADRRLYAMRDISGSADAIPLMVASILSKKLAGGAPHLVLDVKCGSGAQIERDTETLALAAQLLAVGTDSGLDMRVALTDMDQVPGSHAGNALEAGAAIDLLCGRGGSPRLLELSLALAAPLLVMGRLVANREEARQRLLAALESGAAAERFARMVHALGGPHDLLDRAEVLLPKAPLLHAVRAPRSGCVAHIDVRALGMAMVGLGGGRQTPDALVDPAVGLAELAGLGAAVRAGDVLAVVHARDAAAAARAERVVRAAYRIESSVPAERPLLRWLDPLPRAA